jgi:hypothetical protein
MGDSAPAEPPVLGSTVRVAPVHVRGAAAPTARDRSVAGPFDHTLF